MQMTVTARDHEPSQSSSSSISNSPSELELKAESVRKISSLEEEMYQTKLVFELETIQLKREHLKQKLEVEENTALAEERAAQARTELAEWELIEAA